MDITSLALKLVLLLLPGIASAIVVDQVAVHKPWTQFRFVLYSFVLGVLDYLILQVFYWCKFLMLKFAGVPCALSTISFWRSLFEEKGEVKFGEILSACMIGLVLGFVVAKAIQDKWLFKIARKVSVSDKYGDENLFSFFLNANEVNWVYVRDFQNRLTYFGLRTAFSETDTVREIVLSDVTVYSMDKSEPLYSVPDVYLSFNPGSLVIERPGQKEDVNE